MNNDLITSSGLCLGKPLSRKGFTLIEMAFVLVIVGILAGFGAQMIPMLVKQSKLKDDRALVKEAKTALIGYAQANGRLPYASLTPGGTATAGITSGYLPWATLGINGNDAYQNTMFYAVESHLANPLLSSLSSIKKELQDLSNNTIVPDLFCNNGAVPILTPVAFVAISAGENRRADLPNDDTGEGRLDMSDNNRFADPSAPVTSNYDDILEAEYLLPLSALFP